MEKQPHILVIGAGPAGIATASRLWANGFENVTVLEAENRIGGRIHSIDFDGATVDLGAQWVHGQTNNTVYRLVKNLNLIEENVFRKRTRETTDISTVYHYFTFFKSDQSLVDQELMNRLFIIAGEILFETVEDDVVEEESLKEYFLNRYYKKILTEFNNNDQQLITQQADIFEEFIHKSVLCYDAAESWNLIAAKSEYTKCDGYQLLYWKNGGYATFLNVLMNKYPKQSNTKVSIEDKILLNKKVNKIIWDQNNIHPGKVTVQCTDSSLYHVDHVICTVSIAVLKHFNQSVFSPQLPIEKSQSIDTIPLGNVMKIFVKFPHKWWPDELKDFCFLWSEKDKEKIIEEFNEGPCLNGSSWLTAIFGFYTVECDPKVLLGWCVGPMVKTIELLPDDVVRRGCDFLLNKFLSHKFTIPEIIALVKTDWGTNPNFQGTYSYDGISMKNPTHTRLNLIEPLRSAAGQPAVLFAGEAAHLKYFSTVHGAVESGYREADRLIELYQKFDYHQIVIVGAGMAGLAAATKLVKNYIDDFVVLESQATAGGRISTTYLDSKALDLGAQWIHGRDNLLYQLAEKHDLLSSEQSEEGLGIYVRSNGDIVDKFTVDRVAFIIGEILEECSKFVDSPEYPASLADFLNQRFQEFLNNSATANRDIYEELYDWHERFQIVDNSCKSLSRLSAKGWGEYICLDDVAHFNLKNGYQSLIDVILNELPQEKFRYNCEVMEIRYKNKNIELILRNGRIIRCEHLILTPSLGVLKSSEALVEFLPEDTQKSIDYMGFDGICKIFLIYDEKWWKNSKGIQFLWSNDCNFPEKDISWLRQISGFEEVFNHPNVLIGWVGGGGDSVWQVENLEPDEIGKQCTNMMRKFLPNWNIPLPNKVIRTKWLSNPHIKGSYCHITPECDNTNYGIHQLAEPIRIDNVPRILLAGEAIHASHYSTAHGAFESGMDQADIVIDYVKHNK